MSQNDINLSSSDELKSGSVGQPNPVEKAYPVAVDIARSLLQANEHLEAQNEELDNRAGELEKQAGTDKLTGAWNRRGLEDIYIALQKAPHNRPSDVPITGAVWVLDLDHFKQVNDTWGHQTGDKVLVELVRRLSGFLRETDIIARYGGDEFVVLQPGITDELAFEKAKLFCDASANSNNPVSIGVAPLDLNLELSDNLAYADEALFKAKVEGRGRVKVFSPQVTKETPPQLPSDHQPSP